VSSVKMEVSSASRGDPDLGDGGAVAPPQDVAPRSQEEATTSPLGEDVSNSGMCVEEPPAALSSMAEVMSPSSIERPSPCAYSFKAPAQGGEAISPPALGSAPQPTCGGDSKAATLASEFEGAAPSDDNHPITVAVTPAQETRPLTTVPCEPQATACLPLAASAMATVHDDDGSVCAQCAGAPDEVKAVTTLIDAHVSAELANTSAPTASPKAAASEAAVSQVRTSGVERADEFEEAQDFSAEPLESRLGSKDLNRRCSGYAELQARMQASDTEAFSLFAPHLDTCIGETLPKAQDAALSALAVYLERCPEIQDEASHALPLVRGLIEHKAIDKPKLQSLGPPVVMLVAEICEVPNVLKEICDCLTKLENAKKKTQGFFKKQVAFIIKLIYQLLADFGAVKMAPKLGYLNIVVKYITDSDRGIRDACYSVLVELTAWFGDITDLVKEIEEPQKKELTKRIGDLKDEDRVRQETKRLHRGEKKISLGDGACTGGGEMRNPHDSFDLVEAVDALKKLPRGWCIDKMFSIEKWKEKQTHLQVLSGLLDTARLAPNEGYASMVPAFVRLVKTESNIPVVTEVAKCIGLMARGLRRDFERSARQLLTVALGRIIDKSVWKTNVLVERVEQLLWSVPLEFFLEELRPHIASKSLFAKKEALGLLLRMFDLPAVQHGCEDAVQKLFAPMAAAVLPVIDDSDAGVRVEAAKLLAALAYRNRSSPDVGPLLVSRIPSHRRHTFAEEWRHLAKDLDLPRGSFGGADGASTTAAPTTPRMRNKGAGPGDAVSVDGNGSGGHSGVAPTRRGCGSNNGQVSSGGSRLSSPARSSSVVAAAEVGSPSKLRAPASRPAAAAARPSQEPRVSRCRSESVGKSSDTTPLEPLASEDGRDAHVIMQQSSRIAELERELDQMRRNSVPSAVEDDLREQIKALTSALSCLTQDQSSGSTQSRLRAPQGGTTRPLGRSASSDQITMRTPRGDPTSRVNRLSGQSAGTARAVRQMTPPSPSRAKSAGPGSGGGAAPVREAPVERRLSNSSACCPASPQPLRHGVSRTAAPSSARTTSTEFRAQREGSSQSLRRDSGAIATGFHIEAPKQPKLVRQQKERSQYWGPEQIPAEFLAGLKESFKQCVDEPLYRTMFSEKMEEQLNALQSWRGQAIGHFALLPEVLDLVLKWLTWTLFNTNTQVWKLTLDVLGCILESLSALGVQLTDREAQILVPNLVEKSGHNNQTIRESMMLLLGRSLEVYPLTKSLPMLLQGLTSKNKRSAGCVLRTLGSALDRQGTSQLVRSHKDITLIMKMLEDKDLELRKAAVHVVASLSQHVEDETFARITKGLSAAMVQAVRAAVARLPPLAVCESTPVNSSTNLNSSMDATMSTQIHDAAAVPTASESRTKSQIMAGEAGSAIMTVAAAPERQGPNEKRMVSSLREPRAASSQERRVANPSACEARAASPQERKATADRQRSPAASPTKASSPSAKSVRRRPASPLRAEPPSLHLQSATASASVAVERRPEPTSADVEQLPAMRQMPLPPKSESSAAAKVSVQDLVQRLRNSGSNSAHEAACIDLMRASKQVSEPDQPAVVECLLAEIRENFHANGSQERCRSVIALLDHFCSRKICFTPIPNDPQKDLVRELLRHLNDTKSSWQKSMAEGESMLRKMNLCCVMIINSMARPQAYSLLLGLGLSDTDVVGGSLVVKCMRKLNKNIGDRDKTSSKHAESEIESILEVILDFVQKANVARRSPEGSKAVADLWEGAREVVEAAKRANPEMAALWLDRLLEGKAGNDDATLMQEFFALQGEKENVPVGSAGTEGAARCLDVPMDGKRKVSLPQVVEQGFPCTDRNT